jgi:predicted nucleic acid-binding Zn finger protein
VQESQKGKQTMKSYTPTQQNAKLDRIEKAVQLIEAGATFEHKQGVWKVFTDRMNLPYTVENGCCDCYDFTETLKGQSPCKHAWAVVGAAVAMMIHDLRQATNQTALDAVVATYKDAIKSAPDAYVRIARADYARLREGFKAADVQRRRDEANAVLIKSQPQNGARYNGIDI